MSVITPNTQDDNATRNDSSEPKPDVTPKPEATQLKAKRASKPAKATGGTFNKDASLSQVVAKVAQLRNIEPTRAGKLVRSHIRANFERYAKGTGNTPKWAALGKAKENKDGNRYPLMPPSVANAIVGHMTSGARATAK